MLNTNFAPLAQAFGLTVAHSLWQIALIWLVFKCLEWRLGPRHQAVYMLSLAAMLASVLWAGSTFIHECARLQAVETALSRSENEAVFRSSALVTDGTTAHQNLWETAQYWLESHAAQIGWGWLVCAGLLWLRLLGGWWLAQRLRQRGVLSAPISFQTLCDDWAKHLNINTKIQLLESPHISEPLTLGFWKPVVLFPVGMLLQLSTAQVEALLLHELAHIRRHDYFVNLFQLALEVCFFYHPLFWLLSREARSRREFCCDELVLKHTSDPILYAKTLTDLQLSFLQPLTPFVMNATGKSRFSERILHIVGISPKRTARPNWLIVMMLPALLALCSWWPSAQNLSNVDVSDSTEFTTDSLPPKQSSNPMRKVARPGENAPSVSPVEKRASTDMRDQAALPPRHNVAMEVLKMNVFYIGVDNPLRVAVAEFPANEIQASLKGKGSITGSDGNYIVRVTEPGEVEVVIKHQIGDKIDFIAVNKYRVKRIPDPAPRLDRVHRSGPMTPEEMQQSKGINAMLENFDFDALCEVVSFEVTYLPKSAAPIAKSSPNIGGVWESNVQDWIKMAKPGDTFFFDDIKCKCPGDAASRNVGGLAFKIKGE